MNAILERPLRAILLGAAGSTTVRKLVASHGMQLGARRFVAGETCEEFIDVARRVNADGFAVAAGILGEGTQSRRDALAATDQYADLLTRFSQQGLDANVALKVTHLGLDIDPDLALQNVRTVAERARLAGNFMRLDMEQSNYVEATLSIYRSMRAAGFSNIGFVLQSYLYRSMSDLEALLDLGTNVRIVKGAYLEPATLAYQDKKDVDANFRALVERSLRDGAYTAVATHDPVLIESTIAFARAHKIAQQGRYEFQMLYGVSSPLAKHLVRDGYRVRLAVPFGNYWFPYLMRRLAERPANVAFFLKNLISRPAK